MVTMGRLLRDDGGVSGLYTHPRHGASRGVSDVAKNSRGRIILAYAPSHEWYDTKRNEIQLA